MFMNISVHEQMNMNMNIGCSLELHWYQLLSFIHYFILHSFITRFCPCLLSEMEFSRRSPRRHSEQPVSQIEDSNG